MKKPLLFAVLCGTALIAGCTEEGQYSSPGSGQRMTVSSTTSQAPASTKVGAGPATQTQMPTQREGGYYILTMRVYVPFDTVSVAGERLPHRILENGQVDITLTEAQRRQAIISGLQFNVAGQPRGRNLRVPAEWLVRNPTNI